MIRVRHTITRTPEGLTTRTDAFEGDRHVARIPWAASPEEAASLLNQWRRRAPSYLENVTHG